MATQRHTNQPTAIARNDVGNGATVTTVAVDAAITATIAAAAALASPPSTSPGTTFISTINSLNSDLCVCVLFILTSDKPKAIYDLCFERPRSK